MKPQRTGSFIVVLCLMIQAESFAQEKIAVKKQFKLPQISLEKLPETQYFRLRPAGSFSYTLDENSVLASRKLISLQPVKASNYCDQLGIICKKEWQLEKISSIPFRLRLGSLEYVNWLEQKPNAVRPGF